MISNAASSTGSQSLTPFRNQNSQPILSRYRQGGPIRQQLTLGASREARPALERLRRADNVHTGVSIPLERGVRLVRVVDDAWNDDGGGAVLEQVGALGEPLSRTLVREQVVDRPRQAVALSLAGHDDGVEGEQFVYQRGVPFTKRVAVGPDGH